MKRYCLLAFMIFILHCTPAFSQNSVRFSDIKAAMTDKAIEQQALKIANQRAVDLRCPEEYTKATIINAKWQFCFDNDGFLNGRKIHIELYCIRPNDLCGMADFTFKQKYTGDSTFSSKLTCTKVGDMINVACE